MPKTLASCSKFCNAYFTNGSHQLPLKREIKSECYKRGLLQNQEEKKKERKKSNLTALSIKQEQTLMPLVNISNTGFQDANLY